MATTTRAGAPRAMTRAARRPRRPTTRIAATRIATTRIATATARRARGDRSTRARDATTTRRATTTRARAKSSKEREIEATTRKWGLEAGLWKVFKSGGATPDAAAANEGAREGAEELGTSRMDMAKKLLKRYGSAYLVTSI